MDSILENEEIVLPGILAVVVSLYMAYNLYLRKKGSSSLEEMLQSYYSRSGKKVTQIQKLNLTEKFKYGVPTIPGLSFYTTSIKPFLNNSETFYRKIETVDDIGNEQIIYVEFSFDGTGNININEFDKYEF